MILWKILENSIFVVFFLYEKWDDNILEDLENISLVLFYELKQENFALLIICIS